MACHARFHLLRIVSLTVFPVSLGLLGRQPYATATSPPTSGPFSGYLNPNG